MAGVGNAAPTAGDFKTKRRDYDNPVLPGWNSDPSCVFVKEHDNTLFCTTSSFLTYPGIPVYASKDFTNWKLASYAITRPEQLPELGTSGGGPGQQGEGIWASTIRYRNGTFYLITSYNSWRPWDPKILLFKTTDPFKDNWEGPLRMENPGGDIDPDLFWDDDDKAYVSVAAGIYITEMDLKTGKAIGDTFKVWNGTGDRNPEGPHLYKKDSWYYLLIGEGGTETNHSVTIARSKSIRGPYEGYEKNPILTAKNTNSYFQTVGHADLFEDATGNWWAFALTTRSGPEWENYPMGRESALIPAQWKRGEWPVIEPVRGRQSGPLPPVNRRVPGAGPWVDAPDVVDFKPGSQLPRQFVHWRIPKYDLFAISPHGHPNTLRISPSRVNLTSDASYQPTEEGLGFIARKQTSTKFALSVDLSFKPTTSSGEAGLTVFLTQLQHIDLSIVHLASSSHRKPNETVPESRTIPIRESWLSHPIQLKVEAVDEYKYVFTAASANHPSQAVHVGEANATIVSGGSGPFTGKLLASNRRRPGLNMTGTIIGAFATKNGNEKETAPAYFSRWRYTPTAQAIGAGVYVPSSFH
ncbi:arabinofuranosidase [Paraphaeosphaeria minitans]|uniref:Arabinofuranosidase n=1 Tax=Paraphaeosphaeria minitans TaxID=565426 RepID=A0A9P6KSN4_9PLEO|nr:arabinofuranosidase [Paraphaeosphaeria minitans]